MFVRRSARWGTVMLAASLAASACGGQEEATATDPVFALERDVVDGIEPLALVDPSAEIPAKDLRLLLQSLLSEHVMLSIETMRMTIDEDDPTETVAQLTTNTDELTGAIGLIYGRDGAFAFDQLWTNHIEFFHRYASALRAGDETELESVRLELGHYEHDFSSYLEAATAGELDVHTVEHVLHSHVTQLLDQADAWASGRYDRAFAIGLEAHDHGGLIATALASGFASQNPELFPGDVVSEANDRCATAQLRSSFALFAAADAMLADASGDVDRTVAAESAAASALTATEGAVETAEVVDRVLAAFRSEVAASSGAIGAVVPAARDARMAELAALLVDDCS
ncbi:MAG: hypothetical protein R2733_17920 [Acidimicrobiales bacterium]